MNKILILVVLLITVIFAAFIGKKGESDDQIQFTDKNEQVIPERLDQEVEVVGETKGVLPVEEDNLELVHQRQRPGRMQNLDKASGEISESEFLEDGSLITYRTFRKDGSLKSELRYSPGIDAGPSYGLEVDPENGQRMEKLYRYGKKGEALAITILRDGKPFETVMFMPNFEGSSELIGKRYDLDGQYLGEYSE